MPIRFTCPHCGSCSLVSDQYAGESGPCASCHREVTVPSLKASRETGLYREEINPPGEQRSGSDSDWPPMWIIAGSFLGILAFPAMLFFLFIFLPVMRMRPHIAGPPPSVTSPPPSTTATVVVSPSTTPP